MTRCHKFLPHPDATRVLHEEVFESKEVKCFGMYDPTDVMDFLSGAKKTRGRFEKCHI